MPALNQQEGTLTTLGKRVVPTNAALAYHGYELNDLVRELISAPAETIDWTAKLPKERGYRTTAFDALSNTYSNDGEDHRGYLLNTESKEQALPKVEIPAVYSAMEGEIAVRLNPGRQFNDFTNKAHQIFEPFALYTSPAKAADLGARVEVGFANRVLKLDVVADDKIEGDIVCVPDFISSEDIYGLFGDRRYQTVTLRKG